MVNLYAEVSGDRNPIHLDAQFAESSRFGRRIVHGMLVLALVGEMLDMNFPGDWRNTGSLKARFRSPLFPGDSVTIFGSVMSISRKDGEANAEVMVSITCVSSNGSEVITAKASLRTDVSE